MTAKASVFFTFDDLGNVIHHGVATDPREHDRLAEMYPDDLITEVPWFYGQENDED